MSKPPKDPSEIRPADHGNDQLPITTNHPPTEGTPKGPSWGDRFKKAAELTGKAAKATAEKTAEAGARAKKAHDDYQAREKARKEEEARLQAEREKRDLERQIEAEKIQREKDIRKALSRNISTGGSGTPYAVIDVIQAFASSGGTGTGAAARPGDAFEDVKDKLWYQCQRLGGDAVLYCRFEWHKDMAYFRDTGAAVTNALTNVLGAATRTNIQGTADETRTETVITLWGFGTVVKLMPNDQPIEPDDYASWEEQGPLHALDGLKSE